MPRLLYDTVLDHYYLRLRNNCYAVVVGNNHERYAVLSYVKYCPGSAETPWRDSFSRLERVVAKYDPVEVRRRVLKQVFVPFYDSAVPCVGELEIERVYNPVLRARELLTRVRDRLEVVAASMTHALLQVAGLDSLGVTGSVLPSIHNPETSDVDMVVYGWRDSASVIEFVSENKSLFQPFSETRLRSWAETNAEATSLTKSEVLKYYRNYRRGVFHGTEYSIIYNSGVPGSLLNLPSFKTMGIAAVQVDVEGGLDALNYPTTGRVTRWRQVEGATPPMDIREVMSFEATYIPLFYEGGRAVARGLLQCSDTAGYCRVLVGGQEYRGSVIWVG
ncbi:hypothetical protein WLZ34_01120 [Thermogladius sp. KZ2Tp1]|uniref:hypothetical protein n=1 Tax=Thermogladius sp. KZ2Tp1 TaxID=3136289 RepID=UPI003DA8016D